MLVPGCHGYIANWRARFYIITAEAGGGNAICKVSIGISLGTCS